MLCQRNAMASEKHGIFSPEDAKSEVDRQKRPPRTLEWRPNSTQCIELTIPPTVYPPREDTDLMANRIIRLGAGKGRKFLEIGCGSGALSILASSLGWNVHACDINPFAVAATRGNMAKNLQSGIVKEGGIGPDGFPFEDKFDLIIWNLPYIPAEEVGELLGPMEEAGLIDTDAHGLHNRFVSLVVKYNLLATSGKMLLLGRTGSIGASENFAARDWDRIEFDDGESLTIFCLWKPWENAENIFVQSTGSTNDDLFHKSGVGTHISTPLQTSGKGRRDRKWNSIETCYAGSWIVAEDTEVNPGLLQLSGGLAVIKSIQSNRLKLKWPNDILIDDRKLCGVLVEGKSSEDSTKVILGIGINLHASDKIIDGREISTLDEIRKLDFQLLDRRLNSELSSLIEERDDIPPVNFDSIRLEILRHMKSLGRPKYGEVVYDNFELNERGELVLGQNVIDDGEDVSWV
jgi:biotin-[acetyl-CoA-carboxylase] ligase BirA-like protein